MPQEQVTAAPAVASTMPSSVPKLDGVLTPTPAVAAKDGKAPQAANPTDQAAVENVENAKNKDELAAKFAALSREQKKLWQDRQKYKADFAELEAWKKTKDLKTKDPLAYLKQEGINFDDLVQRIVKDGEQPTVEDKVKSIQEQIDSYLKQQKEKEQQLQTKQQQEAIDNFKAKLKDDLSSDKEKWEAINAFDAFESVYEVIEAHFTKTARESQEQGGDGQGEVLPFEKAAQLVEDYLVEQGKKYSGLKKLGQATPNVPQTTDKTPAQTSEKITPTLTIQQSTVTPTVKAPGLLPRDESISQAAKFLQAELEKRKQKQA